MPPAPDWKALPEAVGLPGKMHSDGMFKIALPRPQLGTAIDGHCCPRPGRPRWVGFAPCECGHTMIMGDTCLLRSELQQAIDAYRKDGIRMVAIHNHMFGTRPELMFCHFAAEGDAMELAKAISAVWTPLKAPK